MANQSKFKTTHFFSFFFFLLVLILGAGCFVYVQKLSRDLKEKNQSLIQETQWLNQTSDGLTNKIYKLTDHKRLEINYLNNYYAFVTDFKLDQACLDSQTSIYSSACTPVYSNNFKAPILKLNLDDPDITISVYYQQPSTIFIPHKIFNQKVNLGGKSFSAFQHQPSKCLADCFPNIYLETKLDHNAWLLIKLSLLNADLANESSINNAINTQTNSNPTLKTLRFLDKKSVAQDIVNWPKTDFQGYTFPIPPEIETVVDGSTLTLNLNYDLNHENPHTLSFNLLDFSDLNLPNNLNNIDKVASAFNQTYLKNNPNSSKSYDVIAQQGDRILLKFKGVTLKQNYWKENYLYYLLVDKNKKKLIVVDAKNTDPAYIPTVESMLENL